MAVARVLGVVAIALVLGGCGTTASPSTSALVSGPAPSTVPTTAPSSAVPSASSRPSATPAITGLTGRILFTRAGGEFQDETVFTALADGTQEKQITQPGQTCCPRWSPDGKSIFFAASSPDGRITTAVAKPDGTIIRVLPLPAGHLNLGCGTATSLVTQRLACEGWDDSDTSRNGLYTVRARDSGDVRRLTTDPDHDRPADYSPDGKRIYFFRPNAAFAIPGYDQRGSIYVVNADGSGLGMVTPKDLPVEVVGNSGMRLSPDGKTMMFTSTGVIWTVHADGTGATRLFTPPDDGIAITPTWSPDGSMIMFAVDRAGSQSLVDTATPNALYVMRANGSDLTSVVISDDWKREPDWVK